MQPVIGPLDATSDGTAALQPDATRDGAALHSDATSDGAAPSPDVTSDRSAPQSDATSDGTAALQPDATSDGSAPQSDVTSDRSAHVTKLSELKHQSNNLIIHIYIYIILILIHCHSLKIFHMHKICRNQQNYPIFLECKSKHNFQYPDYQVDLYPSWYK